MLIFLSGNLARAGPTLSPMDCTTCTRATAQPRTIAHIRGRISRQNDNFPKIRTIRTAAKEPRLSGHQMQGGAHPPGKDRHHPRTTMAADDNGLNPSQCDV